MVRLQRLLINTSILPEYTFNPTMVRLQQAVEAGVGREGCVFQSHYGAIATLQLGKEMAVGKRFQSHYGAIATSQLGWKRELKEKDFQSHYGAIATYVAKTVRCAQRAFNPTMVRLQQAR